MRMVSRVIRTVAGAAVVMAFVVSPADAAPVAADSGVFADAQRDVTRVTCAGTCSEAVADPTVSQGDIVSFTGDHRRKRVVVTVRFAALDPQPLMYDVVGLKVKKREFAVVSINGQTFLERGNGQDIRCKHLRSSMDYASDVATFSIPRTCIGNPRKVFVGVQHIWADAPVGSESGNLYADSAP